MNNRVLRHLSIIIVGVFLIVLVNSPVFGQSATVSLVSPASVVVGQTPQITISGTNFTNSPTVPTAVLNPGSIILAISYVSATQLTAPLPSGLAVGSYSLDLTDATNGAAPRFADAITIELQVDITSINPSTITSGQSNDIIISGQNFTSSTTVSLTGFSGSVLTTFQSATQLLITVPGSVSVGTYNVVATDPFRGSDTLTSGLSVQPPPSITASGISPTSVIGGQSNVATVNGTNFTTATTVTVVGFGSVPSTYLDSTRIQFAIPSNLSAGQYIVQVNDSVRGSANSPQLLSVITPTERPTSVPLPTATTPSTDVPGAPNLLVQSFVASPSTVQPGTTVSFTVTVINQGNRVASGVSVAVDSGQKFTPANGKSSIILPDLGVGASTTFTLPVISAQDTTGGMQSFGITFSFRDFSGANLSSKASLSVEMESVSLASQVTLARYQFDPAFPEPGKAVNVTLLLTNTGNQTAGQVLVSIGSEGLLLAGVQGNSFPAGDIKPGESKSVDLPLIVSSTAKSGPQPQSLTISYLQKGESKSVTASMTITIAKVNIPAPIMLLESYETGKSFLEPGEEFSLDLTIKNIGNDAADNVTITFGNVEATSSSSAEATPGAGTTSTPSTIFAPLGSGGTQFAGKLDADGGSITIAQDFIVNASVDSGVYSLPITLRYIRSDGTNTQDNLRASLVVIVRPTIRITQTTALPPIANIGEMQFFTLEIANRGRKSVNFTTAQVTAENADVIEGAEAYIGQIRNDDQTELSAAILPSSLGTVTVTVTLNYTDDLNRPATLVETYSLESLEPPPLPEPGIIEPDPNALPQEQTNTLSNREILGKLLLGLLGLGS